MAALRKRDNPLLGAAFATPSSSAPNYLWTLRWRTGRDAGSAGRPQRETPSPVRPTGSAREDCASFFTPAFQAGVNYSYIHRTFAVGAPPAGGLIPVYYKTGGYVTGALRIDYDITLYLTIGLGGRNLFDCDYALTDGFTEPGRSFFASPRARY